MNEIITLLNNFSDRDLNFESDYIYNGRIIPRVTKILSRCIHNDKLMYWANNLGFKHKSYQKTLNQAANIGTQCHNNIDYFLENNSHELPDDIDYSAVNAYTSFRQWFDDINLLGTVEVLMHEYTLICPYFGGTLDGLYKINGKIYIVDYKTSNHINFNYYLQLSAYRYMLRTELNINVDGVIILQLSKNDISYNEYMLNFDNPNHLAFINQCENTFLSLAYSYYNLFVVENMYNNLIY